jgi:predicted nucleic acid-binding protein
MGLLTAIHSWPVYIDTNIFIYALEGYPIYVNELTELFRAIDDATAQAVTSELTLAEALVQPLKTGNLTLQGVYERAIQSGGGLSVVSVSRNVLRDAARLRTVTGLKLPDAIHGATARLTLCGTVLTNDGRFRSVPGLETLVLSEII